MRLMEADCVLYEIVCPHVLYTYVGYDIERISRNPFIHFIHLCKNTRPEVKIYMEICFTDAIGYWIHFIFFYTFSAFLAIPEL